MNFVFDNDCMCFGKKNAVMKKNKYAICYVVDNRTPQKKFGLILTLWKFPYRCKLNTWLQLQLGCCGLRVKCTIYVEVTCALTLSCHVKSNPWNNYTKKWKSIGRQLSHNLHICISSKTKCVYCWLSFNLSLILVNSLPIVLKKFN